MSTSRTSRSESLSTRPDDVPDELLDETLFDRMKRRLGGLPVPRKSGRLSSVAMDISNLSMNPQFESTRMSFNLGQDDRTTTNSPDGKAIANRSKRRSRKTKMSLLDELREDDEDDVVKKKPRLSHAVETQGNQPDGQDVGNTYTRSSAAEARKNQTVVEGHSYPELREKLRHRQEKTSDISLSRGQERERAKQAESFRVTRARSAYVPEQGEDESILRRCLSRPSAAREGQGEVRHESPYLEEPSPSKVYRMKINQTSASTSRLNRSRDSSRVREVDEEEPGNRTRPRRKGNASLNRSSIHEELSPSKVYHMKTNVSTASTSRQNHLRDATSVREVNEEETGNRAKTRSKGNESLNRTRGSVLVPETCPDFEEEDEEEMAGGGDVTVPETQPIPGNVNEGSAESDSEPVRPRQSNRSRKIVESESEYARSIRSGRVTTDNSDAASSTRASRKSTTSQRRSSGMSGRERDGTDAREVEVDGVSNMEPISKNVKENIANQSGVVVNDVSRRTGNDSSPSVKKITQLIETPSKVRKERVLTPNKRRVSPRKRYAPLQDSSRVEQSGNDGKNDDSELALEKQRVTPGERYAPAGEISPRIEDPGVKDEKLQSTFNKRRVSPRKRYDHRKDSPRYQHGGPGGDADNNRMSKTSGQALERQVSSSPQSVKNTRIVRAEVYKMGDKKDDEIAVNLPEPQERRKENARQGRRPSGSHGKAQRMVREDTAVDADDDDDTTQIKPQRRSRKKLSVVHEEIDEHFGFKLDATADDGNVDSAEDTLDDVNDNGSADDGNVDSAENTLDDVNDDGSADDGDVGVDSAEDTLDDVHDNGSADDGNVDSAENTLDDVNDNGSADDGNVDSAENNHDDVHDNGSADDGDVGVDSAENNHDDVNDNGSADDGDVGVDSAEDTLDDVNDNGSADDGDVDVDSAENNHDDVNDNGSTDDDDDVPIPLVDNENYADDAAVSDGDDDCAAEADNGDVHAPADEEGDESVGGDDDGDIDDDGNEGVDDHDSDDQQNLGDQGATGSAPLIDEGGEESDSDKSSSISQGLRRFDRVELQNVGLENASKDPGQGLKSIGTASDGVAEEDDDDDDDEQFVVNDDESVHDAVNQVAAEKENRLEDSSRGFTEKKLGSGTQEKRGRRGKPDSFEISGIEPVARDEDNAIDKSTDQKNKEHGNASHANTTKGGKAKKKKRNIPATTVHVDVRQHMKDRDFIHQQLGLLAMPINPSDPLVVNVYNKLTAQNVIDEHPIPKDVVQKVFDKVNKKVYEEVHGAFNPKEIQAMLTALDEVRGSTSGAGIDVERTEKQLVALNVERVLETLPMSWPSIDRGNAAVERYNKLRRHVSKLLTSIEDEKKDRAQYKVSVDMVREIRSLQASLDMNELVEEVKRSQHLASQFTKLKMFEKRARGQESFVE